MTNITLEIADAKWLSIFSEKQWFYKIKACIKHVFNKVNWQNSSVIEFILSNDEEISTLNKQYRNKDVPTNVLSFPLLEFSTPTNAVDSFFLKINY
jgi:probable rRNA maturation factor